MPTYEYRCRDCNHQLEMFQKISDAPAKDCPVCGKPALQRGPGGGIGLAFKGSGFYITDYTKSGEQKSDSAQQSEAAPAPDSGKAACACKGEES